MLVKLRILFTTPQNLHHPPNSGPTLRIENSIKALAKIADLTLYVRQQPRYIGGNSAVEFYQSRCREIIFAPSVGPTNPLFDFLRRGSNHFLRRAIRRPLIGVDGLLESWDFRHLLRAIRDKQPDVIWLGYGNISYPLLGYLKKHTSVPVVVDTDSVWSRFILRELPYAKTDLDRARIQKQGTEKKTEEAWATPLADITTAVSEVDADYFRQYARHPEQVQIFANVIDPESYLAPPPPPASMKRPAIYLAGTFWHGSPMEDAARWTINQIMPVVWARLPELHLYIIGAGSDTVLQDISHPKITITGQIVSVLPYLCYANVALVPLRFESGTRFKILEAGACGIPVVSTTLGAEGLNVTHGQDILIADDEQSFADMICRLIASPDQAAAMAQALKKLILSKYSVEALAQQAQGILDHLENRR